MNSIAFKTNLTFVTFDFKLTKILSRGTNLNATFEILCVSSQTKQKLVESMASNTQMVADVDVRPAQSPRACAHSLTDTQVSSAAEISAAPRLALSNAARSSSTAVAVLGSLVAAFL